MLSKPKGTYDLYGKEGLKVLALQNMIGELMNKFNYEYIRTPMFEASELFHRGVGETTDIVTKETYDFKDRGDRDMTLRPEGTAGLVRFFIENKIYAEAIQPKKYWYYGPMFRYERPQSGRYREHYQFGCEVLGSADPLVDAEIISIPVNLFNSLGLSGIKVNVNSLGDSESREAYRNALMDYLKPNIKDLCEDCQIRFEKNPLRILDCKVDKDNEILKNVPKTIDYLNEESKTYFDSVQKYLKTLHIDFEVNPKTVRGFDYYTHTVFEIEASVEGFGSQNVMCGGGRYNNLVENLGGPSVPAVGFGMGTERLITALDAEDIEIVEDAKIDAYVIYLSDNEKEYALGLTTALRMLGFTAEIDYLNRNLKANFKQAERLNATFAIIIGEEEMKENILTVKNLITKEEERIANVAIIAYLDEKLEAMNLDDECGCGDDDCNCDEHEDCSCDGNHEDCDCGKYEEFDKHDGYRKED